MSIPRGLIALLICLPLASCGSKESPAPPANPAATAPDAHAAAPDATAAAPAPGADAPKEPSASIEELKKAYEAAKPSDGKTPEDPKAVETLVKATNAYAYAVMTDEALPPREKYPQSLKLYRESQKLDPKDAESAKWVKEIEDIYKSMGRPIPE